MRKSLYNHNKRINAKRLRCWLLADRYKVDSRKWKKWVNKWIKMYDRYTFAKNK